MKTIFIFTTIFIVFLLTLPAQEEGLIKNSNNSTEQETIIYNPQEEQIVINDLFEGGGGFSQYFYYGDPSGMYLNQEWEPGTMGILAGEITEGQFRYNIYHQKMQAIITGDTFAIAKPCEVEWVQISDKKFIYTTFIRNDREVSNSWFEVLCEGECDLLLRRYIKYRVSDGDDDNSNDQLYKLEDYYIRKEGQPLERLYVSKKTVLEILDDHENELSEYLKTEKIKVKERQDLVKLFAFYNELK